MVIFLEEDQTAEYIAKYTEKLLEYGVPVEEIESRIIEHLKRDVVYKYSRDWQDENLEYWTKLILEVPGGYWQVQELIQQPHSVYEHYKHRHSMSYEKGNVTPYRAHVELPELNAEIYTAIFEQRVDQGIIEVDVTGSVVVEKPKDL